MTTSNSDPEHIAELERIRAEYDRRRREIPSDFYSLAHPANLFLRHGQERALLDALRRAERMPLAGRPILEVGCGRGGWLRLLRRFGADEDQLAGIDLDADRLAEASHALPRADLRGGDAAALPWADQTFSIVLQSTVFTSILDPALRVAVAAEMRRVVAPGGIVLWYDFRFDNPRNKSVRGISRRQVRQLFPAWAMDARRVTLAPPLARWLAPRSWVLGTLLEASRVLNSHDMILLHEPTR